MNFVELLHIFSSAAASVAAGILLLLTPLLSLFGSSVHTTPISITPHQEHPASASSSAPLFSTSTPQTKQATAPKTATSTPKKTPAVHVVPVAAKTPDVPVQTTDPNTLNTQTRGALVNILCTTNTNLVHPISASGVFIDSRGVILTNAHVGQFYLLKDYPSVGSVNCLVRTGNPAQATYRATLLYLPPAWINDNASQLVAEQAKGTGENDYAFLLVTSALSGGTLPASFPALPMTSSEPDVGDNALLAGYPAGFLDGQTIEKNLYITSAYAKVTELFTYGTARNVDLVSIGGTVVSQGGASGGAVVRTTDGKLEGIIATASSADTTAERDLRAITLAHINRSLALYGKGGVAELLLQDLTAAAADFQDKIAPGEKTTLVNAIEKK